MRKDILHIIAMTLAMLAAPLETLAQEEGDNISREIFTPPTSTSSNDG